MSCQTCDKTLQKVSDEGNGVYWCPSCGTLMERGTGGFVRWTAPALVNWCRDFEPALYDKNLFDFEKHDRWHSTGVAGAINRPENRPKRT